MTNTQLLDPIFAKHNIPQQLRGDLLTYLTEIKAITARLRKRFLEPGFQLCVGECLTALTSQFVKEVVNGKGLSRTDDRRRRSVRLPGSPGKQHGHEENGGSSDRRVRR